MSDINEIIENLDQCQIDLINNVGSNNPAFEYIIKVLEWSQKASSELSGVQSAYMLARRNADGNLERIKELEKLTGKLF